MDNNEISDDNIKNQKEVENLQKILLKHLKKFRNQSPRWNQSKY